MRGACRLVGVVGCVLACVLALCAPAGARVKRPFVGMNLDGAALTGEVPVERQMRWIARAGAGSVRWTLDWSTMQPFRTWSDVPPERRADFADAGGAPIDFRAGDTLVAAAVRNGIRPLPVLMGAAPWIAENPFVPFSPPVDPAAFGVFAQAVAARYGTRGSFWRENPELPRRPLRVWQVWNEPAGLTGFGSPTLFWQSEHAALQPYVAMLSAARSGLRAADPRSKLLLGGLFGASWLSLEELYGTGARGLFDAVAIHPYTREPRNVLRVLEAVREVMARNGDARKPVVVTEVSWPSSLDKVAAPFEMAVTQARQGPVLRRAYRLLARHRERLKLRGVFWYTWMTRDESPSNDFEHAGLVRIGPGGSVTPKPALRDFRRTARRLTRAGR